MIAQGQRHIPRPGRPASQVVDDALRQAGRPGRIDDITWSVGIKAHPDRVGELNGAPGLVICPSGRRGSPLRPRNQPPSVRNAIAAQPVGVIFRGEDRRHASVVEHLIRDGVRDRRIEGNDHQAGTQHAPDHLRRGQPVGRQHPDPLSRREPHPGEPGGDLIDAAVEFGPGQRASGRDNGL